MYKKSQKKENNTSAVANSVTQKKSTRDGFEYVDNRSLTQTKVQWLANSCQGIQAIQRQVNSKGLDKKKSRNKEGSEMTNAHAEPNRGPIQRMYIMRGHSISENNKYAINNELSEELYVKKSAEKPYPPDFFKHTGQISLTVRDGQKDRNSGKKLPTGELLQIQPTEKLSESYDRYEPRASFIEYDETDDQKKKIEDFEGPEDCVGYGRALLNNDKHWGQNESLTEKNAYKDYFKHTNIQYGSEFDYSGKGTEQSDNADTAQTGEMMYITKRGYDEEDPIYNDDELDGFVGGEAIFHGATVIARDDEDQITSEAYVDEGKHRPKFAMYGKNNTFEELYQEAIEGKPDEKDLNLPVTGVVVRGPSQQ